MDILHSMNMPLAVICNICFQVLKHRWFRCLQCFNFKICVVCYENKRNWGGHMHLHATQPVLTQEALALLQSQNQIAENPRTYVQHYTCPYCAQKEFTSATLQDHIALKHHDNKTFVNCPICCSSPNYMDTYYMRNLLKHLTRYNFPHVSDSTDTETDTEPSSS